MSSAIPGNDVLLRELHRHLNLASVLQETRDDRSTCSHSVVSDHLALLRLDTDFYASTAHELAHLYPRLSTGGILILDDYGAWQGARQAVDEYFQDAAVLLNRLDWTGRLVMKT